MFRSKSRALIAHDDKGVVMAEDKDSEGRFLEQRQENIGWINLRKPLDLNSVVILIGFIFGGAMFAANVNAKLDVFANQFQNFQRDTSDQFKSLTTRIDGIYGREKSRE